MLTHVLQWRLVLVLGRRRLVRGDLTVVSYSFRGAEFNYGIEVAVIAPSLSCDRISQLHHEYLDANNTKLKVLIHSELY